MTLQRSTQSKEKNVIRLLGWGTAISLLGDATLYVVLPDPSFAALAGVNLAQVSILLGINRFARIFLNGPIGWLFDTVSRRTVLLGAIFTGAVSTAMYATVTGFIPLFIARLLWAIAWSGIWIGGNTTALAMASDKNRSRLISAYQIWFFLGAATASMLGGLLTNFFGFRIGLMVSSGLTLVGAVSWFIWLPKKTAKGSQKKLSARSGKLPWVLIIKISFPVFVARFLLAGVANATTILWLTELIEGQLELGSMAIPLVVLSGYVMASRGLLGMGSSLLLGRVADRLGHHWFMIAAASIIGSFGLYLMSGSQIAAAISGTMILGAATATVTVLYPVLAGQGTQSGQYGRVLGYIGIFGDLGGALGPVLALNALTLVPLSTVYQAGGVLMIFLALFAIAMGLGANRRQSIPKLNKNESSHRD